MAHFNMSIQAIPPVEITKMQMPPVLIQCTKFHVCEHIPKCGDRRIMIPVEQIESVEECTAEVPASPDTAETKDENYTAIALKRGNVLAIRESYLDVINKWINGLNLQYGIVDADGRLPLIEGGVYFLGYPMLGANLASEQ